MAIRDYTDLQQEIANAPEPIILPNGSEVKARIVSHMEGEGEYGTWHLVTFDVPSQPLVKEFRRFISDPLDVTKNTPEKTKQGVFRTFREFTTCFGIDLSRPFDWDDLGGLEGWIILGIKKDDEYGDQNTLRKFVTGPKKHRPDDDEVPF